MRHGWANTALLLLIIAQVSTGTFGLAAGSPDRAVYLWLHNVGAFAILGVLFWKTLIAVRSLKRPAAKRPRKITLVLVVLLTINLALGFTWPTTGYWSVSGISGISLHIWTGIALTPLAGYHAWNYTRRLKVGYDADRRAAIKLFGMGGAGFAAWFMVESLYRRFDLGASQRRFTGSHERGSFRGNAFPVTSWINDDPKPIDRTEWRLLVTSADGQSLTWPYSELIQGANASGPETLTATLDCTGGWFSRQRWHGPRLIDLVSSLSLEGANSIEVRSVTGYYRKFHIDELDHFLLATHVTDEPLSHQHGAPVRLVAPGHRGFEWVKWVTEIHFSNSSHWLQPPFPLQ